MALRGVLNHRKTKRLARLLGMDAAACVGYVEIMFHLAAEQEPEITTEQWAQFRAKGCPELAY